MENFFAIIIGVGGDLEATLYDAAAIKDVLVKNGGYDCKNVFYLIEAHSTKENILFSFDKLIENVNKTTNATVFIYYSGHGNRYESEGDFEYYLKTHGADLKNKEATMLNGVALSEKINSINAEKILVMLDCCHADGMTAHSHTSLQMKLKEGRSKVILSSCDDHEESAILPGMKKSLFTAVAEEVLKGIMYPDYKFISVLQLTFYVLNEVPKRIAEYGHEQTPLLSFAEHLSHKYQVCRNSNYKPHTDGMAASSENIAKDLLNKIGGDIQHFQDSFEAHSAPTPLSTADIYKVDEFLSENSLQPGKVSGEKKKDFVGLIGGMRNLNIMKDYFTDIEIAPNTVAMDPTDTDYLHLLVGAADDNEMLTFIKNYPKQI